MPDQDSAIPIKSLFPIIQRMGLALFLRKVKLITGLTALYLSVHHWQSPDNLIRTIEHGAEIITT